MPTVVPCTNACVWVISSASGTFILVAAISRLSMTPFDGSPVVVSALVVSLSPVELSRTQSVKVPPISIAILNC